MTAEIKIKFKTERTFNELLENINKILADFQKSAEAKVIDCDLAEKRR